MSARGWMTIESLQEGLARQAKRWKRRVCPSCGKYSWKAECCPGKPALCDVEIGHRHYRCRWCEETWVEEEA